MNSSNLKESKINHSGNNFSNSMNEININKKLDEIIDSKNSSENNSNMKLDLFNFKINDNNMPNSICSEQKNKNNKDNKYNNEEINFQSIRLNFEKLMNSDMLADSYDILPSNEQYNNMRNINGNSSISIPYTKSFEDNILLKDESIFFVFDDNYKFKFITEEDIKNIKKDKVELNFGNDPFEIYQQLSEGKNHLNESSFEFYNSLNSFNIFKCKDPYYIKINPENLSENNLNNYYNYNPYNNEQEMKYNDDCNTRENSRNSKIKRMAETMAMDKKNYLLNNEILFNDEIEDEEIEEEEIEGGSINKMDNKFINKKRKNQSNGK